MNRLVGPVVLLAVLVRPACAAAQPITPDTVREAGSGTPFPVAMTPPGTTTSHRLVGTGIRRRTIFRVKVYALGLYVDPVGARAALAGFAGSSARTLQRDARFHRRLLDLDFGMAIRLVMTRKVRGSDVADAFDDALRPRMARGGEIDRQAGAAALARLRSHLDVDEVQRGTEVVLACEPTGRLTASVGRAQRPPIESRTLCRALLDVYLGEDPIERNAKRNIVGGIARLLAAAHGSQQ